MTPTTEQLEKLARVFAEGNDGDDENWKDLYLTGNSVVCTRDSLDDFRENSRNWNETSPTQEISGGLFWERVQAMKGQHRVALAVIDCGEFRMSYEQ